MLTATSMESVPVPWRSAGIIIVGADGRYLDGDDNALEMLGVETVDDLRATSPEIFQPVPRDPEETAAFQREFADAVFQGLIGEGALRRLDGELIRVRTAIIPEDDGTYRVLLYPVERPTTNLEVRVYKIADVLAEWRTAERRLVEVAPETDEGRQLAADVELLRHQYQQLFHRTMGARA